MEYSALYGQYQLDKTIGSGGFAKVKLATHILTGEKVAIKIMLKQSLMEDLPRVKHEINALKSLFHRNICKLYQVIETNSHFFLILEYCCGGELFDHIVEKEKLSEDEARLFFQQIVLAVSYLHSEGFAHRDLKPENILLDKNHNLKLIDFGLSIKPGNGLDSCLYTSCGSPNYAAPELIKGEKYLGPEIDIWSLGVLLYVLLCGTLPFEDSSIQKLYEKILSGHYDEKKWLSSESKALLNSLLQVNCKKRISTEKLKLHPWFKKGLYNTNEEHSVPKLSKEDDILQIMSKHFQLLPEDLWNEIKKEKYDYIMATYLILLDKKRSNEPIILLNDILNPKRKILGNSIRQTVRKGRENLNSCKTPALQRADTYVIKKDIEEIRGTLKLDENCPSSRKNCKRIRSPGLGEKSGPELKRVKKIKTPDSKKLSPQYNKTPCSTKKILVGIEKSISKAKSALTPRRRNNPEENSLPVLVCRKDLCNISSTASRSPDKILIQLKNALSSKGIFCKQKGYTLKGKLRQQSNEKKKRNQDKLSFELEVCWIPSPANTGNSVDPLAEAVVGIRRKRLRGDAWIYKNICEEVLALTAPMKKNNI